MRTNVRKQTLKTVHVPQNMFEETLIEVGSPYLYASFGTFCVQIGQVRFDMFGKIRNVISSAFVLK